MVFLVAGLTITLLTTLAANAQTVPPLTSGWSPGAIPSSGGIVVRPFPVVTGEPFTANDDSRRVEIQNGKKVAYESHSVVARDSAGRIATRTPGSPQVPVGPASRVSVPAGGSITDPVTMVHLSWTESGPPQLDHTVMQDRIIPNMPRFRAAPLNPCERPNRRQNDRAGITQQTQPLGKRTIQGLLAEGCRVTTLIPAAAHSDQPVTITDEWWISPLFGIILLHTKHGTDGTDQIEQLDHIVLGAPDPSLFRPPPDYKIVDLDAQRARQEQSEFTVPPGASDAEMLSGNWEASDPFAGGSSQVGILVKISANRRVPFQHGKVTGTGPQKFADFEVRVYQRIDGQDKGGWFTTSSVGGASWDGNRLQVKFNGTHPNDFIQGELALDLAFNSAKQSWIGVYTRNGETKPVVLTRPGGSSNALSNPFLGGWLQQGIPGTSICIHIAEALDGALLAWRDGRSGPSINPREGMSIATLYEIDGDGLGVEVNGDTLTLQEGIYWGGIAGQLPRKFTGKLSPDGLQIIGSWAPATPPPLLQSQPAVGQSATFTRMTAQSCFLQTPK